MADEPTKDEEVEEVVADESQPVEAPEETTEETTAENEPTEEVAEEQPEEAPQEESPEEAPEEEKPQSRREILRIQKLLQKYGDPRKPQQAPSQRQDQLDYSEALDADPEVIKRLEDDRQATGQSQYNEGLRRAEYLDWKTSLKIDAPKVEQKYPILDKDSPEFHPAVADALNTMYLKMSGFDPRTQTVATSEISYADFVESNMELVEEIAGQKNQQTVKNVAKQTAQTGLRPDGSSAPRMNLNKDPSDMTMEELYASIGQRPPKK